jgi:hypothetical protein
MINADSMEVASTSIVHRPYGLVTGYRRVTDRASRVSVQAFPMTLFPMVSAAGLLVTPGTYIIADDRTAYVGESVRPARRLADHAADSSKAFARDVFVVSGCDGAPFDKMLAIDLQFRITYRAVDAGMVTVARGTNPAELDIADADRSTNDRIYLDALRLLCDAGCWFLHPPAVAEPLMKSEAPAEEADSADAGPITIGVTTTPLGAEEFELTYDEVWARGYWASGHFIVAAGSEIRAMTNGSTNAVTRARRDDLFRAGVLERIPGIDARRRLMAAVAFPSAAIAAKVICGAHTAGRWQALARVPVVMLDALRQTPWSPVDR